MMRWLLDAGADVNMRDRLGLTALMFTARHGGEHGAGMMRLLLDAGADANKQTEDGWTALMHAAQYGGEHGAGMMRLLLDAGADANKQASRGRRCPTSPFAVPAGLMVWGQPLCRDRVAGASLADMNAIPTTT